MLSKSFLLAAFLLGAGGAPLETPTRSGSESKPQQTYDLSQFDEVYDQKQNGTENWRIDVNKVVLVWTPPGNLLTAAVLLDPVLSDLDDNELKSKQEPAKVVKRRLGIPGFLRPLIVGNKKHLSTRHP